MSERYDEEIVRRERRPSDPDPGRPYGSGPGYSPPGSPGYIPPGSPGYVAERSSYSPVRVDPYNYRAVQVAWFVVALIDALLLIRFMLRLLGASIAADFVRFMYGITDPLIAPFRGIFHTSGSGSFVFEPESIIAIIVYTLIGWAIVTLVRIVTAPRDPHRRP